MKMRLEQEIKKGAVGVGFGVQYTPGASHWEIIEMFRLAARHGLVVSRACARVVEFNREDVRIRALSEAIAAAAVTVAPRSTLSTSTRSASAPSTRRWR